MTNVVTVANIATLRSFPGAGTANPVVWVEGYNSLADGGEGMFAYNSADTSSLDNGGTIIVVTNSMGMYRYYREYNKEALNVCWFGAPINSASDSAPALNSALAAIPANAGGTIFFPSGTFTFDSTITYSYSSSASEFSLSFVGAGANGSILYWPGQKNGITINLTVPSQSIHFRDLSITTGQQCGYVGVTLNQTGSGPATGLSDFTRVNFRGASPQLQYWGFGISATGLVGVNYDGLIIAGSLSDTNSGTGVTIQGNTANIALEHNFTKCDFYSGALGINYGGYAQGVTVSQCNFGTNIGISTVGGAVALAQLSVDASQFGCSTYGIEIQTQLSGVTITGNSFYYPTASSIGVYMNFSGTPAIQGTAIIGNFFSGGSIPGTAGQGIVTAGSGSSNNYGVVSGNSFDNMNVGVDLTGAQYWNVQGNIYGATIPTQVIHGSATNSVGVATK